MPRAEFAANEKAIDYQLGTIGIPSENDLQESSGVVYVRAYTKGDGTDVREHYRSAPNRQSNGDFQRMSPDDDGNPNPDSDPNSDQNQNSPNPYPNKPKGKVLKGSIEKIVIFPEPSPDTVELPPDGEGEPQPDPQPEPPPEPYPQPTNEDEEQNISELKEIADLAKQIAQSMNSLKQIASNKADKQNLSLPVSSKYSGAINRHSNQIELSKTNLKRAINKSKISLQKQGNELTKLVDEAVNTTNQSKYSQLMQKITAKKQALSKHSQALNNVESLFQNEDYQGISDGYGNQEKGKAVPKVAENNSASKLYKKSNYSNAGNQNINSNSNTTLKSSDLREPSEFWDRIKFDIARKLKNVPYVPPIATEFAHNSLTWLKDISKNPYTKLVESVRQINDKQLQEYLQKCIQDILHKSDCRGVIYTSESNVAKKIQNSSDFRDVIYRNKDDLFKKRVITLKPVFFNRDADLANSVHNATIYKAWIDKTGNLNAIIFDVYDFSKMKNRGDIIARINNQMETWQEHKNIENYFVIVFVKINRAK